MTVATLRLELRVEPGPFPWERRRRMRAILKKLHRSFNVSVAEGEVAGDPGRAVVLVAAVGRSRREVREMLERVAEAVAAYPRAALLGHAIHEV